MIDCICGYELDTVGLYVNFRDRDLQDASHLLDEWRNKYNVDLRYLEILYNFPDRIFINKYGFHDLWDYLEWFESISNKRHNLFNEFELDKNTQIRFIDHLNKSKSVAIFIGKMNNTMQYCWDKLLTDSYIPLFHLTPDDYKEIRWIGNPRDAKITI